MRNKISYEHMSKRKKIIKKKALELRKERKKALGNRACDLDSCLEFVKSRPYDEEWLDMCIRSNEPITPAMCKVCRSILGDNLTLCALVGYDEYFDDIRPKLVLNGDRIEFQEGMDEFTVTAYDMELVRRREMRKDEWRKWKAEKMGMASKKPDEAAWHSSSWLNNCCGNCAKCVELYRPERPFAIRYSYGNCASGLYDLKKIPCYEDALWYMRLRLLDDNGEKWEWECNLEGDCDFCLERYGNYCCGGTFY